MKENRMRRDRVKCTPLCTLFLEELSGDPRYFERKVAELRAKYHDQFYLWKSEFPQK
jgi:hypothetical protein